MNQPSRCPCGTPHTTHHDGATVRCPHCDQGCRVMYCSRCDKARRAHKKREGIA